MYIHSYKYYEFCLCYYVQRVILKYAAYFHFILCIFFVLNFLWWPIFECRDIPPSVLLAASLAGCPEYQSVAIIQLVSETIALVACRGMYVWLYISIYLHICIYVYVCVFAIDMTNLRR